MFVGEVANGAVAIVESVGSCCADAGSANGVPACCVCVLVSVIGMPVCVPMA